MILASKSPRRKEILENIGFKLEIKSEDAEEISNKESVIEKIKDIAFQKVEIIAQKYPNEYVVGADTIVELDGKIIGKPQDKDEAFRILKTLSGKSHNVVTAYSFINKEKDIEIVDYSMTKVYFKKLNDELIRWYIESGEPMDKAGAYGIQNKGAIFVEKIEGDFFTVMGFPIEKFVGKLSELGIDIKDIKNI